MMFVLLLGKFMEQIISLWVFSCNLYSQPRIKAACLYLQDEHEVNVPLLLFCCWTGQYYQSLSPPQFAAIQESVEHWTAHCILPLRQLRRSMKTMQASPQWETIREQVKSVELAAEKQLILTLEQQASAYQRAESLSVDRFIAPINHHFGNLLTQKNALSSLAAIVYVVIHAVDPEIQYDSVLNLLSAAHLS
jgi:uncharacterized protein (TIGR02444 family)